jgi:CRISPR-associated protein Csb2
LHAETGELQRAGWTLPPGSRFIDYVRPHNCFDLQPTRSSFRRSTRPTFARFSIQSPVLPRVTRAVSVGERVHQALLARFPTGSPPEVFTGRDQDGKPLVGHRHAFILSETNGQGDAITHLTIFAPNGFDAPARLALESLQRVWGHGGHDLQLILLGFGDRQTFGDAHLLREAKVWRSLTPFIATRHPKRYRDGRPKLDSEGWQIGSPAHDLRRLITEAGLPLPLRVEELHKIQVNSRSLHSLDFQTERRSGNGLRSRQSPAAFQITFAEKVAGPLTFGYGSHFGLGLFVPVSEERTWIGFMKSQLAKGSGYGGGRSKFAAHMLGNKVIKLIAPQLSKRVLKVLEAVEPHRRAHDFALYQGHASTGSDYDWSWPPLWIRTVGWRET